MNLMAEELLFRLGQSRGAACSVDFDMGLRRPGVHQLFVLSSE